MNTDENLKNVSLEVAFRELDELNATRRYGQKEVGIASELHRLNELFEFYLTQAYGYKND